ncbi:hypothetical protein TNCV_1655431 [Trichonephila clavipes]|nr:hypothetical protein TNCV_1655431 [Trichonephila clavipes]
MPPNTLRVHTEYVLVKSLGPKVLWAVAAEPTSAGSGEYSPPSSSRPKLWVWRSVVSPSIVKNFNLSHRREFHRAKSYYPPVWCSRLRPTTGVPLAHSHDEFRGPRSDTVRQVALATTATKSTSIAIILKTPKIITNFRVRQLSSELASFARILTA